MGENIKELLNEEIAAEIQAISSLDSGSEKKSTLMGFVRILCLTNREGDIVLSEGINSKAGRNLLR